MPDLIDIFPKNQQLALARTDLQFNFETINDIWGVNHIDLEAASNNGKHSEVDFLSQVSVPAGIADTMILANIPDSIGNLFLHFIKQASDTKMEVKTYNTPASRFVGIRLPSGIILKYAFGAININTGTTGLVTFKWSQFTNNGQQDIPFTTPLWAQVFLGSAITSSGGNISFGDNELWCYVEDFTTNPSQIVTRMWDRQVYNDVGENTECILSIVAIGV